ncbi:MAG: sulfatase [Planctomycetales bacterium]|nr:sulfatase [Planctomycetales bacterium]
MQLSRRSTFPFARLALSPVWLLVLSWLSVPLALGAEAGPPNVVMIISDDQAWTDYGFMGHPHIQTPRLDQLARESLTFARGYVPDSLCRPSLATMITGLYPHQHRIVGNDPPFPESVMNLPPAGRRGSPEYLKNRIAYLDHITKAPTLPRLLGEAGYRSHQSGKWWEGSYQRGGFTHGMTHGDRTRGGRHGDLGLKIGREGMAPVHDFIDECQRDKKPFFIWYAPFLPHTPHTPPERLLNKYRDKTDSLPIAKYWAMCEWFDETCGQLLDHLEQRGLSENTIVLYVCDNGWINDPQASRYAPRSKRSQYEGGIRTPIMVRWPGKVKPQHDTTTLASSIDLAPTVLAACGVKAPEGLPGVNLLDASARSARKALYGEILEHDIQHMTDPEPSLRFRWIIRDQWKLIVPHPAREPKAAVELFDVLADPTEQNELAAKHPDVVAKLRDELDQWWKP